MITDAKKSGREAKTVSEALQLDRLAKQGRIMEKAGRKGVSVTSERAHKLARPRTSQPFWRKGKLPRGPLSILRSSMPVISANRGMKLYEKMRAATKVKRYESRTGKKVKWM
jgi:hypothetical protein